MWTIVLFLIPNGMHTAKFNRTVPGTQYTYSMESLAPTTFVYTNSSIESTYSPDVATKTEIPGTRDHNSLLYILVSVGVIFMLSLCLLCICTTIICICRRKQIKGMGCVYIYTHTLLVLRVHNLYTGYNYYLLHLQF